MAIDIQSTTRGKALILSFVGELDAAAADSVDRPLLEALNTRPMLTVIDLSELAFISSLGMGKLVTYRRAVAEHGGEAAITGANEMVFHALERGHLTEMFVCFGTVDDAIADLTEP